MFINKQLDYNMINFTNVKITLQNGWKTPATVGEVATTWTVK